MHGHGQSGGERYYVQISDWVADIRAAIDVLPKYPQIDPARIGALGLSSGGTAILEAAIVEPRLKTLIALAPTVCNSLSLGHSILFKLMALLGGIKRGLTGRDLRIPLIHMAKGVRFVADPEINRSVLARIEKEKPYLPLPGGTQSFLVDTIKRVGKITVPVLIIWGEKDEVDPLATGRLLYDTLKCKKTLEIIPGNGHATHLDRDHEKVFALAASWASENLPAGPGNMSSGGR
jgi:pimeloyl-ACP methyl ester carboxylesterase